MKNNRSRVNLTSMFCVWAIIALLFTAIYVAFPHGEPCEFEPTGGHLETTNPLDLKIGWFESVERLLLATSLVGSAVAVGRASFRN